MNRKKEIIKIKDNIYLMFGVLQFIQKQEQQRGKMMGYIYMFIAVTADFVSLLVQKSTSNVSPSIQLQVRLSALLSWNWLIAKGYGYTPEPISSAGFYACLKRGISGTISIIFYANAVPRIDVSELSCVLYCAPVVVLLLGKIFLGEILNIWDILASMFSLTGMTMVIQPPFLINLFSDQENYQTMTDEKYLGLICILGSMLTFYSAKLNIRIYSMIYYYGLGSSLFGGALILMSIQTTPVLLTDYLKLILAGLFSCTQQIFLTKSVKFESSGKLMAVNYLAIIYSQISDFFIFGLQLELTKVIGCAMMCSCAGFFFIKNSLLQPKQTN